MADHATPETIEGTSTSEKVPSSSISKDGRKLHLFKAIQGRLQHEYPTKYLWDFYHDKHSNSTDYADRLTLYNDKPIDNMILFMQYYNNFPFTGLRMKDAAHFFKHTVKPIWEDARNQDGGAWHFRIPEEDSNSLPTQQIQDPVALQFFQQVLLAAVSDDFGDLIQPRDDICGVSVTRRWKAWIIMIWTRRAGEVKTIQSIKDAVLSEAPTAVLNALQFEKNCYYKKHREHDEFDEALAKRLLDEYERKKAANEIISPDDERPCRTAQMPF